MMGNASYKTMQNYFSKLRNHARKNGFKLLDSQWLGSKTPHRFLHIKTGAIYVGKPSQVLQDGFPLDLRGKTDKLKELARIAKDAGFNLLEDAWLGTHVKHRFIQIETEIFYQGVPSKIFTRGFPKDILSDQKKLEALSTCAKVNGFQLIDDRWIGSMRSYLFFHIASKKTYVARAGNVMGAQGFPKYFSKNHDEEVTALFAEVI